MAVSAPAVTGQILLSTVQGRLSGQTIVNTFTHVVQVLSGAPTVGQVYDAMKDDWWTGGAAVRAAFRACLSSDYILDYFTCQVIHPVRYKRANYADPTTGSLATPVKESATAQVIYRSGDLGSRKDQSSLHLTGAPNGLITDGIIDAGQLVALNALAVKCKTAYNILTSTVSVTPVIFHRGPSPSYSVITDAIAKTEVRTMRRRVVGRGI